MRSAIGGPCLAYLASTPSHRSALLCSIRRVRLDNINPSQKLSGNAFLHLTSVTPENSCGIHNVVVEGVNCSVRECLHIIAALRLNRGVVRQLWSEVGHVEHRLRALPNHCREAALQRACGIRHQLVANF